MVRAGRTSGEEDAGELGDEESEADADGSEEGALVLLGGEHEDGEDELGRKEHFNDCEISVWIRDRGLQQILTQALSDGSA